MDKILFRLSELLKVKSIVTIVCIVVFAYMAVTEKISETEAMIVITAATTYLYNKDTIDKK